MNMQQPLRFLVLGLGETGKSVLSYCQKRHLSAIGFDTRAHLSDIEKIKADYSFPCYLTALPDVVWESVSEVIVSPGLDLDLPVLKEARARGLNVIGDIELFYREAKAPIIGITGTNAKSTVTTLVTNMINAAGKKALMGGNIGIPALQLLDEPVPDYYVLELSSFQLELTQHFRAFVGVVLNISPDHLDRHHTMEAYTAAKMRIYQNCAHPITEGRGERLREEDLSSGLSGRHNLENAQNALAITAPLNLPLAPQLQVLKTFKGLPHRCVLVAEINGVKWVNDSKGTNVGATLAAINGLGPSAKGGLILLLGGLAKDQDFTPLREVISKYVSITIVFGQDRAVILKDLKGLPTHEMGKDFKAVLENAAAAAKPGSTVLLSPACASQDMFKDYNDRGDQFVQWVETAL